ncbi:hypothetical protein CEXT_724401 [Caerostris extrusa]|uniref:Uncharacterized protein n=1 Tax=Caerostris extrusa TaxID=172846 RepID=A0AAV4M9N0_CAEEX|nr:hypothetical protein CEXT_724401 [Caerostris extrusa]
MLERKLIDPKNCEIISVRHLIYNPFHAMFCSDRINGICYSSFTHRHPDYCRSTLNLLHYRTTQMLEVLCLATVVAAVTALAIVKLDSEKFVS